MLNMALNQKLQQKEKKKQRIEKRLVINIFFSVLNVLFKASDKKKKNKIAIVFF